jgi:hypothetical protein
MTPQAARQAIRDRILALTPSSAYADAAFALAGITWVESKRPLMPELSPTTLAALAFTVDDRTLGLIQSRPGVDDTRVACPLVIRFLYPLRATGPENSDWDRSAAAAVALWNHLTSGWDDSTDLTVEFDASRFCSRRIVGTSEEWVLVEVYLTALYLME